MEKWWQDPRLDDEGTYDYLIEELPQDYAKWEFDREYKWACGECGRESHLLFRAVHYFYCWDGWDSMEFSMCLVCYLKNRIAGIKWKITSGVNRQVKIFKDTMMLYKANKRQRSFRYWYKFVKGLN